MPDDEDSANGGTREVAPAWTALRARVVLIFVLVGGVSLLAVAYFFMTGSLGCGDAATAARWVEEEAARNGEQIVCTGAGQLPEYSQDDDWYASCYPIESLEVVVQPVRNCLSSAHPYRNCDTEAAAVQAAENARPGTLRCQHAVESGGGLWMVTCYRTGPPVLLMDVLETRRAPCETGR